MTLPIELPPEAERYRDEVRGWLAAHPSPSRAELAGAGLVAPHWPRPWGLDADPLHQLVIDEELRAAGVRRPVNPVGIGWAGPTILAAGTEEQQQRFLPGILDGSELWCQLFSEPGAGSDLARLSVRARLDGDEWVVTGQKVWNGMAQWARYGILLARTHPQATKQHGVTYFACPMDTPGIEVRPLRTMTGDDEFTAVFFDDARIPAGNVIGEPGQGWPLAKVTLANERVALSSDASPWGVGPTVGRLVELARRAGEPDPLRRQAIARLVVESRVIDALRLRTVASAIQGRPPGPESSIRKLLVDLHGQRLYRIGHDLAGADGLLAGAAPYGDEGGRAPYRHGGGMWDFAFLFSPALTIGGGTSEVQRTIIGEKLLGLPKDVDADDGVAWADLVR